MSKLQGKSALVTGGGSGIGLAVARRFLDEGASVAITGRTEAKLQEAAKQLGNNPRLFWRPCDLSHAIAAQQLADWATQQLGRIDILVNNAGLNVKKRSIRELTPESWDQLVGANLDSAFYCIHAILPQMAARKDGMIINISSTSGKRAGPLGGGAYSAAKAGLAFLSHTLGIEEREHGIRTCTIFPGEVDTPILDQRPTPVTAEQRAKILLPEDVAEAVLFVASLPARASVPELIIKPTTQPYS